MMKIKHLLFAISLIMILAFNKKDSALKAIPNLNKDSIIILNQVNSYKMLYENQVKSNDAILKTIYYALGGLGTAILLVFGSNWWFNDKKVRDVINEIDSKINNTKKDILLELTEKNNLILAENNSEIRTENQLQIINFQNLLKSYNENLSLQITTLKLSYEEKIDMISDQIRINDIKNNEKINKETKPIKRDLLNNRAELFMLKDHYHGALMSYLELTLNDNSTSGYDWAFEYNIKGIITCLEKLTFIMDYELKDLNSILEISKEKHFEETEKIKILIKDLPIKN